MRFKRSSGISPSEKILADLCDRSFLSLWSYPNLYRRPGKELCDLMVVFGNDIVIFSDKSCAYPNSGDVALDWERWFRRSISKSADQIRRAEDWILKNPTRVFLDPQCTTPLPLALPTRDRIRIHRVCIALGASERNKIETGKTSLTVSALPQKDAFTVGPVERARGWVHVFDKETTRILLSELSTTADFLAT